MGTNATYDKVADIIDKDRRENSAPVSSGKKTDHFTDSQANALLNASTPFTTANLC